MPDSVFDLSNGFVIQMIKMVVRNNEKIDVGNIFGRVDLGSRKSLVDELERCSCEKYRIDEIAFACGLDQVRGMSKPENQVFIFVEL